MHDYSTEKPVLTDIGHNHFVFGSSSEIEAYKAQREGEPLKSIKILTPEQELANAAAEEKGEKAEKKEMLEAEQYVLDAPVHDTGNKWYSVGSFFLPIFGLIGWLLFKHFKYYRNYKACKKGTLWGLGILGGIIVLYLLLLLTSLL